MLFLCFFGRNWQFNTSEPVTSMNMFSQVHYTLNELIRPSKDRNITPANIVEHIECILSCIFKVSVPRRGRDSKEMNPRIMSCIDESKGVVKTRVTIQPDGLLFIVLHITTKSSMQLQKRVKVGEEKLKYQRRGK